MVWIKLVGFGQLLDRLHEGRGLSLETVAALGKEHAEQPRVVERREHLGRDLPLPLGACRLDCDQRSKLARPIPVQIDVSRPPVYRR